MSASIGRWAADVDRENAELHRLREQVAAARAKCREMAEAGYDSLGLREIEAALGEAQR